MITYIYESADSVGKAIATLFTAQVLKKPDSVLGFATGSTPVTAYRHMIELYKQGIADYSKVITYNLDEYCGLTREHPQSYYNFMMENLFSHINVPAASIHIPNGLAQSFDTEASEYETAIDNTGGIDLQLLGLGTNGHIGFNEPSAVFPAFTHKTELTPSTIAANSRFFSTPDEVPRFAITMGIKTIMKARTVILAATGEAKAAAVRAMIKDSPDPKCPASVLQLHSNAIIFLDKDAAGLL